MFRDTDRELARLEAELLKEEALPEEETEEAYPEEALPEYFYEDAYTEGPDIYQNYADGYPVYNSDVVDTDLEEYSREVQQGSADSTPVVLAIIACLLALGIAAFVLLFLLRNWGILR